MEESEAFPPDEKQTDPEFRVLSKSFHPRKTAEKCDVAAMQIQDRKDASPDETGTGLPENFPLPDCPGHQGRHRGGEYMSRRQQTIPQKLRRNPFGEIFFK